MGGIAAPLAFLLAWAVLTPALVSGTLLAETGGLVFGRWTGTAVSVAGATVGGLAAFALARRLGTPEHKSCSVSGYGRSRRASSDAAS